MVELVAAVATLGAEDIPGQAFRMNTDQNLILRGDFALDQRQVLHFVHVVFIDDQLE